MRKIILSTICVLSISTAGVFAQGRLPAYQQGVYDSSHKPHPLLTLGGGDAERDWGNTGTDFNTGANWAGGTAPGVGDVAYFKAAEVTQPNVSASLSIAGLYFNGTGSNGYDVTANGGVSLTLTGRSTSGSGGTSDSGAAAIRSDATSGTNTVDVPLILASTSGISTFFNAAGGTLIVNGAISSSGTVDLSLKNGTIQLNGNNSQSSTSIDAASTTVVLGSDNALGTGTFTIGSTSTLQAGGGARTIANNVVFGGNTTLSGGNAFTFNGTATSSGSSSRTLTVSNTGGAIFGGTVNLEESGAPAGRAFTINGSSAVTINGVVQDGSANPALLKYTGSNTLTLNNANTYSGGTQLTIAGSTLVATTNGALGTGNVSLTTSGVTLTLQTGVVNPNIIADSANLSLTTGSTTNLNFTGNETVNELVIDGVIQPAGTYNNGNESLFLFGTGNIVALIPEPSTWMMLVLGAGLLLSVQRFRRKLN